MYSIEYSITKEDLDIYEHVNHARYLTIFEKCRWHFGSEIGFDQEYVMKEKKGVVIVDLSIQYLREARLGDVFEVKLSSDIGPNNTVIYKHELFHKERKKVYCKETVTGVIMDLKTRRKIDVPADFKAALDDYQNKA